MHCSVLLALAACPLVTAQLVPPYHSPGCASSNRTLSCSRDAASSVVDGCCVETRGGLVVATQLWSTYTGLESRGQVYPRNEWSIHGLWPDYCNGSYTQYCDLSRQYDPKPSPNTTDGTPHGTPVPHYTGEPIDAWFEPRGKSGLLQFMQRFWVSQNDANWIFWAHEYSKHATCFSSFDTQCYHRPGPHADLFDFFETTVTWHQFLPTYDWLATADITPSNTTAYSLSQLQHALAAGFGHLPFLGCTGPRFNETPAGAGSLDNGRTHLSEVWYFHHVYGRVQDIDAVELDANAAGGRLSTCAAAQGAVWYHERTPGSHR